MGREIIDVLARAADLDWFRYPRTESEESAIYAPVTVWRFTSTHTSNEQSEHVISALRAVLDSFSGNVSWSLTLSGRNWVLLPTRVKELEDSRQFRTDGELLDYLLREEPGLGPKAHEDLAAIADALAKRLSIGH